MNKYSSEKELAEAFEKIKNDCDPVALKLLQDDHILYRAKAKELQERAEWLRDWGETQKEITDASDSSYGGGYTCGILDAIRVMDGEEI